MARYVKLDKEDDDDYGGGGEGNHTVFLKTANVDFTTDVDFDELEEINRPSLEESYQVTRTGGGSFDMWGRANSLPLLLWAMFGNVKDYSIGTDAYRFVFIPDTENLRSLEIIEGKKNKEYPYPGQVIQSMEFTAEMGEVLTISVESIGQGCDEENDKEDNPDFIDTDDCPVFTLRNATVKLGSTERTDLRSLTIEYNNNISEDEHTLGDIDLQDRPPGQRREITLTMEFREEDEELFDDFVSGTEAELEVTFETTKEIEDEQPFQLKFVFPRIQYRETEMEQSGRDPIRTNVEARALYDEDVEYNTDGGTDTTNTEVLAELVCDADDQIDTS